MGAMKGLNNSETAELIKKLHFQLNLGKPLKTFLVLSYFKLLLFDLFIANSWKSINIANKPDLQWELNH